MSFVTALPELLKAQLGAVSVMWIVSMWENLSEVEKNKIYHLVLMGILFRRVWIFENKAALILGERRTRGRNKPFIIGDN